MKPQYALRLSQSSILPLSLRSRPHSAAHLARPNPGLRLLSSPPRFAMSTTQSQTLDPKFFNEHLYRRILALWFDGLPQPASEPPFPLVQRWFGVSVSPEDKAAFDDACNTLAREPLLSIAPGKYPLPEEYSSSEDNIHKAIAAPFASQLQPSKELAPEEVALALMLLLDQMPRNCFRADTQYCYQHYDRVSRAILRKLIIPQGLDMHERYLDSPPWEIWFYLPLMHSEDLRDHDLLKQKLEEFRNRMREKGDQAAVDYLNNILEFEKRHRVILDRFSRYPHRNVVVGRESTREEEEYLKNGGETFGG